MADGMTIAARSMADDIQRLAAIGHNLANAATTGFKRDMTVGRPFAELLQAASARGTDSFLATRPLSVSYTDHLAGPMQYTGNALDIAIEGDGFFELEGEQGPIYTRAGNFQVDANGRLVDADGRAVAGLSGEIRIDSPQLRIDREGRMVDGDTLVGQLRVMRFAHPEQLVRLGSGHFAAAGEAAQPIASPRVRQGYLEASNVVSTTEMVRMIETMRHFEANQKVIQGYGDVLERVIRTLGDFNA